jgi:hypothetical protein
MVDEGWQPDGLAIGQPTVGSIVRNDDPAQVIETVGTINARWPTSFAKCIRDSKEGTAETVADDRQTLAASSAQCVTVPREFRR